MFKEDLVKNRKNIENYPQFRCELRLKLTYEESQVKM